MPVWAWKSVNIALMLTVIKTADRRLLKAADG
jgi:hypothetical protein